MTTNTLLKTGKVLLISSLLAFAAISLQACNDQAKEVKTAKTLKSNCQMKKCGASMKCKSGKCGTAKTMKCQAGKCGDAKKAVKAAKCNSGKCGDAKKVAPVMKCQAGKCGQGK